MYNFEQSRITSINDFSRNLKLSDLEMIQIESMKTQGFFLSFLLNIYK